jgi:hypothetical protein
MKPGLLIVIILILITVLGHTVWQAPISTAFDVLNLLFTGTPMR